MVGFLKKLWNNLPVVIVGFVTIEYISIMLIYYNEPIYGFNEFGPFVILTCIFPILWIIQYFIGSKREQNKLNELKANKEVNQ